MEKPHCCKHRGLKILSPSLNVKDTQTHAHQHSQYPWGEASFRGDAVWECLWKNILSSHRHTELISHNMEERGRTWKLRNIHNWMDISISVLACLC